MLVLTVLAAPTRADPATPVRVAIECEDEGRTKACPAFLLGFLDAHDVLMTAPRAAADVIVYVAANEIALVDRVHLRFVATTGDPPQVVEHDVDLDTRATDDAQRARLEAGFLRGIALFVAARYPDAVTTTLTAPRGLDARPADTTPWDAALSVGASGNRTERFRSYNGYASLNVSRLTPRWRIEGWLGGSGNVNRQPPLVLDDGTRVSLDLEQWNIDGGVRGAWLYRRCWSVGGAARISGDDPNGQYAYTSSAKAGVEWDLYAADDPRGNRLAILYSAGYVVERYNLRNVIGERFARYPVHGLVASGTLRRDRTGIGVSLAAGGQLDAPARRYHLTASPFIELQLGGHVDLNVSLSVTSRELPAPDEALIDPSDYAQLSRLAFAEPLAIYGSLNVTIHFDRTNAARNDRFSDL